MFLERYPPAILGMNTPDQRLLWPQRTRMLRQVIPVTAVKIAVSLVGVHRLADCAQGHAGAAAHHSIAGTIAQTHRFL